MLLAVAFANSIVLLIAFGLFIKSRPILAEKSLSHLLLSSSWHPFKGEFGFYPFIVGTLEVTAIAMILSVPVCLLSAIYLSEYARNRFRNLARLVIDIMAAIPSVIYGLWGLFIFRYWMLDYIEKPISTYLGWLPIFSGTPFGLDILSGNKDFLSLLWLIYSYPETRLINCFDERAGGNRTIIFFSGNSFLTAFNGAERSLSAVTKKALSYWSAYVSTSNSVAILTSVIFS